MPTRFRRIRSWPIRSTYASWIAAEMRREEATMNNRVRDVMNSLPEVMDADASVAEAAQLMREKSIGDVMVVEGEADNRLYGIITDRDIVVRTLAEAIDPTQTRIGDSCSRQLRTVWPDPVVAT